MDVRDSKVFPDGRSPLFPLIMPSCRSLSMPSTGPLATAVRAVLLCGVYFVAAKLSLQSFASIHQSVSPVWATTGIALAALILGGYGLWPGVFAGAYLVNATTSGAWVSLGIAAGNT